MLDSRRWCVRISLSFYEGKMSYPNERKRTRILDNPSKEKNDTPRSISDARAFPDSKLVFEGAKSALFGDASNSMSINVVRWILVAALRCTHLSFHVDHLRRNEETNFLQTFVLTPHTWRFIVDSWASVHLVSLISLTSSELSSLKKCKTEQVFKTTNGIIIQICPSMSA